MDPISERLREIFTKRGNPPGYKITVAFPASGIGTTSSANTTPFLDLGEMVKWMNTTYSTDSTNYINKHWFIRWLE